MAFAHIMILAAAYWLLLAFPAQAYIDPGTGSMLLQAIIACAISGMFILRMYWNRTVSFVLRLVGRDKKTGE